MTFSAGKDPKGPSGNLSAKPWTDLTECQSAESLRTNIFNQLEWIDQNKQKDEHEKIPDQSKSRHRHHRNAKLAR
jgi:hypothetical protein